MHRGRNISSKGHHGVRRHTTTSRDQTFTHGGGSREAPWTSLRDPDGLGDERGITALSAVPALTSVPSKARQVDEPGPQARALWPMRQAFKLI